MPLDLWSDSCFHDLGLGLPDRGRLGSDRSKNPGIIGVSSLFGPSSLGPLEENMQIRLLLLGLKGTVQVLPWFLPWCIYVYSGLSLET